MLLWAIVAPLVSSASLVKAGRRLLARLALVLLALALLAPALLALALLALALLALAPTLARLDLVKFPALSQNRELRLLPSRLAPTSTSTHSSQA